MTVVNPESVQEQDRHYRNGENVGWRSRRAAKRRKTEKVISEVDTHRVERSQQTLEQNPSAKNGYGRTFQSSSNFVTEIREDFLNVPADYVFPNRSFPVALQCFAEVSHCFFLQFFSKNIETNCGCSKTLQSSGTEEDCSLWKFLEIKRTLTSAVIPQVLHPSSFLDFSSHMEVVFSTERKWLRESKERLIMLTKQKVTKLMTRKTALRQQVSKFFSGAGFFDLSLGVEVDSVRQQVLRDSVGSGHVSHRTSSFDDHYDHCCAIFKDAAGRTCPCD